MLEDTNSLDGAHIKIKAMIDKNQHYKVQLPFFGQTGLGKQCQPRSDCSYEQFDQGLHCWHWGEGGGGGGTPTFVG